MGRNCASSRNVYERADIAFSSSAISSFFILSMACMAFWIFDQLDRYSLRRYDLPGHAKLILQPTALNLAAAG